MDVKNPLNIPLTQTHLIEWVRHVQGVLKVKLSRDLLSFAGFCGPGELNRLCLGALGVTSLES